MKLEAEWTLDCQGKQDYDAELVSLSTRYWPRGGGFSMLMIDASGHSSGWQENDSRAHIRPSASSSILLQGEVIAAENFEGETEAEVKSLVEAWAEAQFAKLAAAVRAAFAQGA